MGLIIDVLKSIGIYYHKCPRCNYPINKKENKCKNCGQPIKWKNY